MWQMQVVMSNGIVKVTISKPDGFVTGISYQGVNNLLESHNEDYNRGCVRKIERFCRYIIYTWISLLHIQHVKCCDQIRYWDLVWSDEGTPGTTGNSER